MEGGISLVICSVNLAVEGIRTPKSAVRLSKTSRVFPFMRAFFHIHLPRQVVCQLNKSKMKTFPGQANFESCSYKGQT